ncbi:jtb protein-related [Anaeramoeba ignava]|uniref:Jtb protein-related n=1 Tax=Anaeramoeba ignava TaxID=1746090 RepID=A0A9Q0RHY8_ANAIG|nr:jtb protein-related [Anaeramoeba ignava]
MRKLLTKENKSKTIESNEMKNNSTENNSNCKPIGKCVACSQDENEAYCKETGFKREYVCSESEKKVNKMFSCFPEENNQVKSVFIFLIFSILASVIFAYSIKKRRRKINQNEERHNM